MSFPTTSMLDDFNRANTGPPPSANWTTAIFSGESGMSVSGNTLASGAPPSSTYWSAASYGPDVEVYATILNTTTERGGLLARLSNLGAGALSGYYLLAATNVSAIRVYRIDATSLTQLGADISQVVADGDAIGMALIGSAINVWYKNGGNPWAQLSTRTDSNYISSGRIGVRALDSSSAFLDDFGGGTIGGGGSTASQRLIAMAM